MYYIISSLLNFLTSLGIGTLVFIKNRKSAVNKSFILFTASVSLWAFGYTFWQLSQDYGQALFWIRLAMVGSIAISPAFTDFIIHFVNASSRLRLFRLINWIIGIIIISFSYTGWFIQTVKPIYVFKFWPVPGFMFYIFHIFFILNSLICGWLVFSKLKSSTGITKVKETYILISSCIGFIGGMTNHFLWYGIIIPPFGNIGVAIGIIITAYAIVRYRFMDVRIAFTRAGIFTVVYILVLGIPFWLGFRLLGDGLWILPVSIMAVFATLGPLTYNYLRKRTENIILKEQRYYQEAITKLSKRMVDMRDIEELLKTITLTIADAVKIKFAAVYLKTEEYKSIQLKSCYPQEEKSRFPELIPLDDPLIGILNQRKKPLLGEETGSQNKIDPGLGLIIPCFGKDGFLGFIALGAKQNNQMYTNDDILSFENLSYSTSLAIENCTYWKEIEDRQRKARLQEMDTFSYSLAHEIDNPMTIVYNLARFQKEHFLKYITDSQERKDAEDACDIMMEGSGRVMSMVKAIRQFGQKVTGELEPLNLQEIIEGFSRLYSPELKANCVLFSKEMPDQPIYVKGVAAELQQVLMIFAKNAIHAMQSSQEKKLTLKVVRVNHSTVRIALSDTGYGVKGGNLQTIFAPFFTSKASTEGTGMGLHNAKGFILRHNGRIWAESEGENKGSTFIFELPVIVEGIKPENIKTEEGKTKWAF